MTDLGTEFGVEVKRDGGSEVHVLEGQVDLATLGGGSRVRIVAGSQNSAARIDKYAKRIMRLPPAAEHFVRAMPTYVVEWSGNQPLDTFAPAQDDLLQTNLASASTDDGSPPMGKQPLSSLYDGRLYGPKGEDRGVCESLYGFSVRSGKSITFVLDTTVNRRGYTIDAIDVYTGCFWMRLGQKYQVEFSQVGQDGWLASPVLKCDRRAQYDDGFWEARSHIQNRTAGTPLVTNVNRIRFTIYDQNRGLTDEEQKVDARGTTYGTGVYREIDVFGSPTSSAPASGEPKPQLPKDIKP